MVRKYKAKNPRRKPSEQAIEAILGAEMSYREAGAFFNMSASTLFRSVRKRPGLSYHRVFTDEEEALLADYLLKCSSIGFGLTRAKTRQFVYEYAVRIKLADDERKYPPSWDRNKTAGVDFLLSFLGRHPELALRKPEPTSIARAIGFNRHAVELFYANLREVHNQNKFRPHQIFNLDETGLLTVVPPPKVLAKCGIKQVSQITSAERGNLVTFVGVICADVAREKVPPVFVFPRKKARADFLIDAPEGSIALANSSGWMTSELFLKVLEHIQAHTQASVDNKILLLLDNHESHISLAAIEYCVENGIVMLSFPPHTSHRLQPLDVAVYGPFKRSYASAQNDLLAEKSGKSLSVFILIFSYILYISGSPITIYDVPKLAKIAYAAAFTDRNILAAFEKPGIVPLNSQVFGEDDFALSYVTDRPHPENANPEHVDDEQDEEMSSNNIVGGPKIGKIAKHLLCFDLKCCFS
jgi:DDE superfamily endonuclease